MTAFRLTYITFDCYGTSIHFHMSHMTRMMFGNWQPYADVIKQALRRCCTCWGLPYRAAEAQRLYDAIPAARLFQSPVRSHVGL